jgi:kynurenine 3-monooxygenase
MRKNLLDGGRSINLALSNRGIRALEEVGLADQLKEVAIPMHGRMIHDLKGNTSFQPYGKQGQYINSISRSGLNIVLMDQAEEAGVDIKFNSRITEVDLENTSLTINNEKQSFDLVVGADGAFSAVRGAMQITDRFDYTQFYIEHGYKELTIPSGKNADFLLEKNALHIWPRESFMLIALPNPDGTFTCTLFFPFEGSPSFNSLNSNKEISAFFESKFPDAFPLMPTLLNDFQTNPTSSLVTIKCFPWVKNKTFLIGDAAHGIVPFYGQGMNSGFEDCRILNQLLDQFDDNWDVVLNAYQELRKKDADAIAQLALDNFVEMRDLVADEKFILQKKIEARLHELYPSKWKPLYSMVTFYDDMRYSDAQLIGSKQKKIMAEVLKRPGIEQSWEQLDFQSIVNQLG